MNQIGKLTTFYDFISGHDIEIPRVQRDYTYGAGTKKTEEVLNSMLSSIRESLLSGKEMILDFVYGSRNKNNLYNPLDGQQRLTTLFLLHLYAGWTEGKDVGIFHFYYSTRGNTADFCKSLISKDRFIFNRVCWKCGRCTKISEQIKDCSFFRPSFNDDPSIRSMLAVLDRIDLKFKDLALDGKLWDKLTIDCPVKFFCLDFGRFGLSDDLYIKMNSRGKTLTDYEIFKSQLEKYIDVDLKEKDLMYEFAIKFDTDFTDLVWHERNGDLNVIDDSFVSLFRNLLDLRNFLRGNSKSLIRMDYLGDYIPKEEASGEKDDNPRPSWYLDESDVRFIIDFFDRFYSLYKLGCGNERITANDYIWGKVFYSDNDRCGIRNESGDLDKIRVFKTQINLFRTACSTPLQYAELVMLYAMFCVLGKYPLTDCEEKTIDDWRHNVDSLRHIRNLIENSDDELSRPDYISNILKEVELIISGRISEVSRSSFNKVQFLEEQNKELNKERWKSLFAYENHDIFRGALSLMAYNGHNSDFNIAEDSIYDLLISRLNKINTIFDNSSRDVEKDKLIRATLLSHSNFGQTASPDKRRNRDNRMYGFTPDSWRLLLTNNSYFTQTGILNLLDSADVATLSKHNTLLPYDDWRYYASHVNYCHYTYVAYNMAKYGYYYTPDPSKPLEVFLLQSTSCSSEDNIMWKMMNRILWHVLIEQHVIDYTKCSLGYLHHNPVITIDNEFSIDFLQDGWAIQSKKETDIITPALLEKQYSLNGNIVRIPSGTDFIQFGVKIVKDVLSVLMP